MMQKTLLRICELQPKYSSQNTPEMAERGRLVRTELAGEFQELVRLMDKDFGEFARDIAVEGSDGIGSKTEAPWVRIFSREMSPTPREGFYIVVHFTADGAGLFITVGCGSTIWKDGSLNAVSNEELKSRTGWARSVIKERWGSLEPFRDQISLGAKAPLPRTFEKATAFAKRFAANNLVEEELETALRQAADRLTEIYRSQKSGRDVTPGDQAVDEIQTIARPLRARRSGHGFTLTAPERKAIEMRAMDLAQTWLETEGYKVTDTSANQSYDFIAEKAGLRIYVEVKGTTSDICSSILMTKNEVDLHRQKKGETALILVAQIRLDRTENPPKASHGTLEAFIGWNIDDWSQEPIAFQISR